MARSGVIYGASGNFKTTAVKHFSHYIYELTGKSTLLLSIDGGGWDACVPEILAGIISPYRCSMEMPLPILRRISQGYWPEDPEETTPSKINMLPVDWNKFGGIAVESLTSFSQAMMRYLSDKGMLVGGEKVMAGRFDTPIHVGGQKVMETFGSSTQGHYGFTQNVLYTTVMSFNGLPCNYVLFTALETKTEEEDRSTIYGPQVAGKKATSQVPSWVGDCIHSEASSIDKITKVKNPITGEIDDIPIVDSLIRCYFVKHPDPVTGIMFPAKPRVTPERVADLMKAYPGGFFVPTPEEGFDRYLKTVDDLQKGQGDAAKVWRAKIDEKFGRGGGKLLQSAPAPEEKKG